MKKLFITLFLTSILYYSCSDKIEPVNEMSTQNDILTFSSQEEYNATVRKTLAMNTEELKAFESEKGFISFGRECDEFYNSIVPEDFKSMDEIINFVKNNSKYIEMVVEDGDTSIYTKYFMEADRYIMNPDKMYQINNTVFKVIDKGILSTTTDNVEELKNCNDGNYSSLLKTSKIYFTPNKTGASFKSTKSACSGDDYSNFARNGNERIVMKLWAEPYYENDPLGNPWDTHLAFHYKTYPQKRSWGAWFGCSRTITANFKATVFYGSHSYTFGNFYYHEGKRNIEDTKYDPDYSYGPTGPQVGIYIDPDFSMLECNSHIPKPATISASCN